MPTFGESDDLATCSFCDRSRKQVAKLIAGPGVYICDECTGLCDAIIDEEGIAAERRGFISARSEMTSPSADGASAAEGRASVIEGWASLTGRLGRGLSVAELATEPGLDEDAKPRSLAGHRLREQLGRLPA